MISLTHTKLMVFVLQKLAISYSSTKCVYKDTLGTFLKL